MARPRGILAIVGETVVALLLINLVIGLFHARHHTAAAPAIPASVPGTSVTSCAVDPAQGIADVKGNARNTTGALADLTIEAAVYPAGGGQLATTWGHAAVVPPGVSTSFDAPGMEFPLSGGAVVCRVLAVTWTAHTAGPLAPPDPGWSPYSQVGG